MLSTSVGGVHSSRKKVSITARGGGEDTHVLKQAIASESRQGFHLYVGYVFGNVLR